MTPPTPAPWAVREIGHHVRIDLVKRHTLMCADGRKRTAYGLRLDYRVRRDVSRVDVVVEFRNRAELFPPSRVMPDWMREIVTANRPGDVDSPDEDRRTGAGGWPL